MHNPFVSVLVLVRRRICHERIPRPMDVLMMLVMHMRMVMLRRCVLVLVLVPFGEV